MKELITSKGIGIDFKRDKNIFSNMAMTLEDLKRILIKLTEAKQKKVVFIFCEIDCREGMAMALERGKYGTIDEAADVITEIYVCVLRKMVMQYNFKVYVHPVLPVLAVTRELVNAFNKALVVKVKKSPQNKIGNENLIWLDYYRIRYRRCYYFKQIVFRQRFWMVHGF